MLVRQLSFVEFAIALGIMIRGTDDAKLELAFKILSPALANRRQKRMAAMAHTVDRQNESAVGGGGCPRLGQGLAAVSRHGFEPRDTLAGVDTPQTLAVADERRGPPYR